MARTKKKSPARKKKTASNAGNNTNHQDCELASDKLQQALSLLHHGRRVEAEGLFTKLLQLPLQPPAFINQLGVLAHLLGKRDVAIDLLQRSVAQEPSAPLLNNLGLVREQLGDLTDAQNAYAQALNKDPGFAEAHYNLGNVLQKQRSFSQAIEEYRRAISCKHEYPAAYNNMACAQYELGALDEAEQSCLEAVRLHPAFGEAINTWSRIMQLRDDPELMLASCRRLTELARDKVTVFASLGGILAALGKKPEAISCYQNALRMSPDNCKIHFLQAMITKYHSPDDLGGMEEIYAGTSGASDRHFLCFALGKAYEDIGEYRTAFKFIKEGNDLLRATYAYALEADRKFINQLKSTFQGAFISRSKVYGHRDATPIFIVGMPRSGTTLVEQILASHPLVHGAGELPDLDLVFRETLQNQGTGDYPAGITALAPEQFSGMGAEYIARIRRLSAFPRIVDKMPHNFLFIGLIQIILPDARIIHCRRDPMDTCWSMYKNVFDTPHPYAQDLNELGRYYRLYLEIMAHWQEILPGSLYEVAYEKLISDQENETRRLLEHCALPWDESCLNFHQSKRRVLTSSMAQVRQPLYTSSLQKWRCFAEELQPLQVIMDNSENGFHPEGLL